MALVAIILDITIILRLLIDLHLGVPLWLRELLLNPLNLILLTQSEGNMRLLENLFGTIALITTLIGLLPQIYKVYITKSSRDLSMAMLINFLVCSGSWLIYGIITNSEFVFYSNAVGVITSVISIRQKLYYDQAKPSLFRSF